jgi:hypothetical protein
MSFSRVKGPRRGVDHPPPSSAEVKESVELSRWTFMGVFQGKLYNRGKSLLLFLLLSLSLS